MSGIIGIINVDGEPVDRGLLARMTHFMTFRGPDAQRTAVIGHVGLGHTLLKTTDESESEHQPFTLDGSAWIVADARVDGQDELIAKLSGRGEEVRRGATDVELLLRAYRVWGEACVEHLLGDFAFAMWDGHRRRLFCARDHFGIKLFYYARVGPCLLFSNTLDCIRQHPAVSGALNETAIGDFLITDYNQNPETTVFSDIQCLPPAHVLTYSGGEASIKRYWTLPVDPPLLYKRSADYVEHFRHLLRTVVNDRLRTDRVAVYMSGGLDSTTTAATARELLANQHASFDLRAYTVVYDSLIPDQERYYSGLAASALGIPIHYLVADGHQPFERWDLPEFRRPEPDNSPLRAISVDQMSQIAAHSRVAFYCEGPDNLLHYEWRPYVDYLIHNLQFGRLAADVGRYVVSHRRLPLLRRVANRLTPAVRGSADIATFPEWLNLRFSRRLGLEERWEAWQRGPVSDHPVRPKACASLEFPNWRNIFEGYDPGVTGFPIETRYPFMDLRMIRYLLSVPSIPWCADKHLVRAAMRGVLPEAVRRRPKAPLAGDPVSEQLRRQPGWCRPQPDLLLELCEYVDGNLLRRGVDQGYDRVWMTWINLRPLALNWWLKDLRQQNKTTKENCYEARDVGIYQEAL